MEAEERPNERPTHGRGEAEFQEYVLGQLSAENLKEPFCQGLSKFTRLSGSIIVQEAISGNC